MDAAEDCTGAATSSDDCGNAGPLSIIPDEDILTANTLSIRDQNNLRLDSCSKGERVRHVVVREGLHITTFVF